ncbi:MAG: InlB B-repeat-containing protein [Burkholderiales bacterium]|nr:InlB B-repeat-containing protein [Burkholderiales bacterium]
MIKTLLKSGACIAVTALLFAAAGTQAQTTTLAKPAAFSPKGSITQRTPTYQWYPVAGATHYRLQVRSAAGATLVDTVYTAAGAGCPSLNLSCYAAPRTTLPDGSSSWQVRAQDATTVGPWSDVLTVSLPVTTTPPPAAPVTLSVTSTAGGVVQSGPGGIQCGGQCNASFAAGTVVTLTATPFTGYRFAGWSGACTGTTACTVTMDIARSVSASFVVDAPSQALAKPVSFSPRGSITQRTPTYQWYPVSGATHYRLQVRSAAGVTLVDSVYTAAGVGCTSASQSCYAAPVVPLPDGNSIWQVLAQNTTGSGPWSDALAVTLPTSTTPWSLVVSTSAGGTVASSPAGIQCGALCSATYAPGTVVVLTATPASGYRFVGWSGACSGTAGCSVTMDAAKSVSASFAVVTPPPSTNATLAVGVTGQGSVSITGAGSTTACASQCTRSFSTGTTVSLTASPAAGHVFGGWSGACTGLSACSVTMDTSRSVTAAFVVAPVNGASAVPLTLAASPTAAAVPVRSGVPFPPGALASLANLRLESADGSREIPAQFDTLAAWPDGSMKSVLVQFVADAGPARSYRLVYGSGVARAAVAAPVKVQASAGGATVDTGSIRFQVNTRGLLAGLWRDADHNGSYDAAEQVLGSGEFFMVNAFDGQEYTASQTANPSVAVEEAGPIRAVVRARGALTNAAGAVLIKYQVRYYAYAGSDKLDIDYSVIDDRPEANVASVGPALALSARGYGLRWNLPAGPAQYRFGLDKNGSAGGSVSGEHYLLQNGSFVFDNGVNKGNPLSYTGVATGLRAPGWVALDAGSRHLALMVRDFWQQFPIELNVKGNVLTAALFAERSIVGTADTTFPVPSGTLYKRPNSFYFSRPGGAKTHQLRLAFGDAMPSTDALAQLNAGYQRHRLELTADPAWYAASGVFGELDTGNPAAATGYSAMLVNDIYIPSIERATPESITRNDPDDRGGDATMFGWRDYGDRLRAGWNNVVNGQRIPAFYNDTHIGANAFLREFVRTGEQRWFHLGEIATRHFADLDVAHGPRRGYWETSAADAAMGQQPAGEVHALAHNNEDHQVRNQHWGHAHVSGLSDLYLLTGDKRSLEVLTEIAQWWKHVTPHFFKTPFDPARYREAERDYGWPLYVMNEYVRVTGDAGYHKAVNGQLVNYLVQWWRTPLNHIGYNPATQVVGNSVIGVNDASKGTGYWTMTRMDNSNGTNATGTNPWMAGALLSNVIKFYEQDKLMAAAGKGAGIAPDTLEDMLFQCLNYVVKHGWVNDNIGFAYSEVIRNYSGGHTLLDYPLAYLDRLYRQRLAAGAIANPQWYDTQPQWRVIAKKYFDGFNTTPIGSNTQSYGFYGYEMVYPPDFFKIMSAP